MINSATRQDIPSDTVPSHETDPIRLAHYSPLLIPRIRHKVNEHPPDLVNWIRRNDEVHWRNQWTSDMQPWALIYPIIRSSFHGANTHCWSTWAGCSTDWPVLIRTVNYNKNNSSMDTQVNGKFPWVPRS